MTRSSVLALFLSVRLAVGGAELADAVEHRDAARIKELMTQKAELNAAQPDGMTALHWAVFLDEVEWTRELLEAGANARAANRYQVTPLSLACTNGNAEIVEQLLAVGANPAVELPGGETSLMTAARTGNARVVKALLARGVEVNARERRGQTALMWAAAEGNTEAVKLLLAAGADFSTPLENGFTPLFFAVREGKLDTVRALLAAGAEINGVMEPKKPNGKSARPGTSPLALAVENGHFDLAVALLDAGADPNDQRSGFAPLHILTWVRKPNRGDGDDGDPPPIGSGKIGSLEMVRKLVEHGADVNERLEHQPSGGQLTRAGATPFFCAALTDDAPMMHLLVELGADATMGNAAGASPLLAAAGLDTTAPTEEPGTEEEAMEALQLTIKLGNDINGVDRNGETAMHAAAYKNAPKVVRFLQEHGCHPEIWNQKNKHGSTPLRIAEGYRPGNFKPSPETVTALQEALSKAEAPKAN